MEVGAEMLARMKNKFYTNLFSKDSKFNTVLLTKQKYDSIIADVKRIKVSKKKESSRDYRIVERYDVLNVYGLEKLIEPLSDARQGVKMFVHADELFDVLYLAHISINHGGRDKMIKQLHISYKNVTQAQIKLFLDACEVCQQKHTSDKRGIVKPIVSQVDSGCQSTGTTSKDEDKKMDHIPLEPAIEIKEEPVDYEPAPSTSTEAANEEFILPHEESTWTPAVQSPPNPAVEPQLTLSVAGLASHNNLETSTSTSNSEQVGKKRKIKSSTFVPSTNGSEARPVSPVYNFGESSNPGSLKEPRKDQFDVFGEYIAAKLRSLDKKSRAYAQKAIGDIIFEAEMGKYLNEDSETKVLNTSGS